MLVSEVKDDVFSVNARRRGDSFVFASENVTNGRVELEDSSARANRRCTFPSDIILVFASTSSALQPATKSCGKPSQAISPSAVLMVRACLMPEAIWEEYCCRASSSSVDSSGSAASPNLSTRAAKSSKPAL